MVEVVVGQRLRAEPLGVGGRRLVARVAALVERDAPAITASTSSAATPTSAQPQAALRGAPLAAAALVEEGALARGELGVVVGGPVERRRQARAAIELAGVAAAGLPFARGAAEVAVQPPALGVFLEPAAQARPLAQQRLVRDLDLAVADREQAARR